MSDLIDMATNLMERLDDGTTGTDDGMVVRQLIEEIDRLRALVADAIRNGLVIESCDRCGADVLSLPRDDHPEGILWCAKCAAIEAGGEK